ncbi:hypothetical protein Tco_1409370 [Tanacetum coccineum]
MYEIASQMRAVKKEIKTIVRPSEYLDDANKSGDIVVVVDCLIDWITDPHRLVVILGLNVAEIGIVGELGLLGKLGYLGKLLPLDWQFNHHPDILRLPSKAWDWRRQVRNDEGRFPTCSRASGKGVEFEEAPNKDGSRAERESYGRSVGISDLIPNYYTNNTLINAAESKHI